MQSDLIKRNQSFWDIGCILGSAIGLPPMVISGSIAKTQGPGTAILAILIGNTILWMIGLAIFSMAKSRHNAIDNVREYLGKTSGIIAAFLFSIAILIWYALQIKATATVIGLLNNIVSPWKIGAALGIFVALLSLGGVRLIRRIGVLGFPLLFCLMLYGVLTSSQSVTFAGTWRVSFSAIVAIVLIWLPGIVSLPTFFRHVRSKEDAVLGLSLITLFHSCFEIFGVFMQIDTLEASTSTGWLSLLFAGEAFFIIGFFLVSMICVNLANIYWASAPLEIFFPRHHSTSLFLLVGICGTAAYVFFDRFLPPSPSLVFLEAIAGNFIISLGVVLLIDLLIKLVVRHRLRPLEQFWSSFCWLFSCLIAVIIQLYNPLNPNISIISAVSAFILFLLIIFIEETVWSAKKLR